MQLTAYCKEPVCTLNKRMLHLPKTWRIMKLTTILMLITCLQVSAKSFGQLITLAEKKAPLTEVFTNIEKQSGYAFYYKLEIINQTQKVDISVKNMPLVQVLNQLFQNLPFAYNIVDKNIVVKRKNQIETTVATTTEIAPIDIKGIIQDEDGSPLMGASVKIKGANKGVASNANGEFLLVSVPTSEILVFSFVGYETQEIPVEGRKTFFVRLKRSTKILDETMVIGYGTTSKRLATGTVARITAEDISKQPVTNVLLAMQGRTPGVYISQNNGLPGAGITVQIRGVNSLTKSNLPLYIIDGVPYLSDPINIQTGSTATLPSAEGNTHPLNTINPSDIESIDVLKDADATAIYGSRAANGVVLITTKKGKAGKTQLTTNINTGQSEVAHFVTLLNTSEYLALRRKGFINNGIIPTAANAMDLMIWDTTANIDFQKILLGNTSHMTDVSTSLSGGDLRTNFLVNGTYHQETNIFPTAQGYKRVAVKFSLNHASIDRKFNLGLSAMYSADRNNITATDLTTYAYNTPPNFPLYNADGSLYWTGTVAGTPNPMAYFYQSNDNRTSNLLSSLNLKYTVIKGLDVKATVGFSRTDMDQVRLSPTASFNPAATITTNSIFSYNYTNNYIVEPQATYKTPIWKGTLEALVGGTWQFKQSKQPFYTSASGFVSDEFLRNPTLATTVTTRSYSQDYKYTSLFGRLNYNIAGTYLVNLVMRRDGSSRFGPNNKFGNFGSVGAAWIFTKEKFASNISWLSFGKIRGSYGIVGSDAIGNYGYLDTYSANAYVYNGTAGLIPSRLANSDFKWEETKKLEAAIDLGFLNDKILFSASFYRNRTGNQLISNTVSAQAGFTSYQANLPALVENKGIELSLNTTNISNKHFTWSSMINLTINRNKLLQFDNIQKTTYYSQYIVGNPISSVYLYKYIGIDTATGLPSFQDANKDGSVTTGFAATGRGDRQYMGTTYAKFYGGFSNTFKYKGFALDVMLQFVKQDARSIMSSTFYPPGYVYNGAASVMYNYLALGSADKLITTTTATTAGRAAYIAYSNYTGSDASFIDASFIKLRNVSFSYSFPEKLLKKAKISNMRLYVQGQNLFTITSYDGYDPESQGVAVPPLRTITAGIQLTF